MAIDLNDHVSVAAAQQIENEYGKLDILVNNASIVDAEDGPPSTSSAEAARRINLAKLAFTHYAGLCRVPPPHRLGKAGYEIGGVAGRSASGQV